MVRIGGGGVFNCSYFLVVAAAVFVAIFVSAVRMLARNQIHLKKTVKIRTYTTQECNFVVTAMNCELKCL